MKPTSNVKKIMLTIFWVIIVAAIVLIILKFVGVFDNQEASLRNIVRSNIPTTPTLGCSRTNLTPQIQVLSPNGGETYTEAQTLVVKWTSCNIPANQTMDISLDYKNMGINPPTGLSAGMRILGTPNDGSQTITLPTGAVLNNLSNNRNQQFGTFYKIAVSNSSANDFSDNPFTINSSTGCPSGYFVCVTQNGSPTNMVAQGNNHNVVTMKIPVKVTAGAKNVYIPMYAVQAGASSNASRTQFAVDNAGTIVTTGAVGVLTPLQTPVIASTSNGHYMIPANSYGNFELTVTYTPTAAGQYRATLLNMPWSYVDHNQYYTGDASTGFVNNAGAQVMFRTSYVAAQ